MITTIIFDLSEVLLTGAKGSWKSLQKQITSEVSDENLLIDELDHLFLGRITEQKYWEVVIERNSWQVSVNQLKDVVRNNFQEIKGVRKVIQELKEKGYKLGLLSNHAEEWIIFCETNYKYHDLFDEVVYSYQAKLSKPNPNIFLLILKKLNVKPEECLFIDDYIKNIEAAQQLGFNTIHFTSINNLKQELKFLKILLNS